MNAQERVHYYRMNNQMLVSEMEVGNLVGCFCLGLAAALYELTEIRPPVWIMKQFTNCSSVAAGLALYNRYRSVPREQLASEYFRQVPPEARDTEGSE